MPFSHHFSPKLINQAGSPYRTAKVDFVNDTRGFATAIVWENGEPTERKIYISAQKQKALRSIFHSGQMEIFDIFTRHSLEVGDEVLAQVNNESHHQYPPAVWWVRLDELEKKIIAQTLTGIEDRAVAEREAEEKSRHAAKISEQIVCLRQLGQRRRSAAQTETFEAMKRKVIEEVGKSPQKGPAFRSPRNTKRSGDDGLDPNIWRKLEASRH